MTSAPAATNAEEQFVSSLPVIERIVLAIARRHLLNASDAEEFGAWAKARLIEDDYAVFRKFGGRSSLSTYLVVVLRNLYRDYQNSLWGRWRPSAAAKRLGPVAVRLEQLLVRDGMPLREATNVVRSFHDEVSERELIRMAAALPRNYPTAEVSLEGAALTESLASPVSVDQGLDETPKVEAALHDVLAQLPPEDAVIVRMKFWSNLSVADIARSLRLEQKSLYRRLERISADLRDALAARGIDRAAASDAFGGELSW